MPVDHKLCSGLDPVGENLLSSLKKPPSPPNRRWLKPVRRPRPAPEAETETLAPFLELDGCSPGEGMTLPRRETPLSTRGIRDTSRRILTQFIFSLFSAQSLPLSLYPVLCSSVVVASARGNGGGENWLLVPTGNAEMAMNIHQ